MKNRNVIMKEAEEILKYKTLNNRITGHVENKKKVVPLIIGATVTI